MSTATACCPECLHQEDAAFPYCSCRAQRLAATPTFSHDPSTQLGDLALPLLVARVLAANYANDALAPNDLAAFTDTFDGGLDLHLHFPCWYDLVAVNDASLLKVVRAQFNNYFVAREDPDVMLAHLAGDGAQHLL